MGRLSTEFANLVKSASSLPLGEAQAARLQLLTAPALETIAARASDLLGDGTGALLAAAGISRSHFPAPLEVATLSRTPGFEAVLGGARVVAPGEGDQDLVRLCQRALQAVFARTSGAPEALALLEWGADGGYGDETVAAVAALRRWKGLSGGVPGVFGRDEAQAVRDSLAGTTAPDLFPGDEDADLPSPAAERIARIATRICEATLDNPWSIRVDGRRYTYAAEHFGVEVAIDGWITAPGGIRYRVKPGYDYWKCNIFGGTCISLAELPVPIIELDSGNHFHRAERFGGRLAKTRGWTLAGFLDHRDPSNPYEAIVGTRQDEEIRALLKEIRPGDLFFVDHPGEPGNDGGHTRVCVEAAQPNDTDVAPAFAQARYDKARIEKNGMTRLSRGQELQFWLLRYTG